MKHFELILTEVKHLHSEKLPQTLSHFLIFSASVSPLLHLPSSEISGPPSLQTTADSSKFPLLHTVEQMLHVNEHVIPKRRFSDLHNTFEEGFNKVPLLLVHTIDVLIRIFQNNKKQFA